MRLDGDDLAFLCPYLLEQGEEELASLGGLVLEVPEAREVGEDFLGLVDAGVDWRSEALQLFLDGLAAHRVLGLGEVAQDVEVLEALQLGEQFASPLGSSLGCGIVS